MQGLYEWGKHRPTSIADIEGTVIRKGLEHSAYYPESSPLSGSSSICIAAEANGFSGLDICKHLAIEGAAVVL